MYDKGCGGGGSGVMNHSAPVVLMGVVGSHATACVNSDFDDDGDSAGGGDGVDHCDTDNKTGDSPL